MHGKPKAFEEIKHNHDDGSTPLQMKLCERCHFDIAEKSLVDHIKKHTDTEKTKGPKAETGIMIDFTFSKLFVHRGKFDDVIGWSTTWQ